MSGPVEVTLRGAALWARIDRTDAANACGSAVMAGLEAWLARASEPGVRVLVLTGTGRHFCAGADMTEGTALLGDQPALRAFLDRGRQLVRAVRASPVPTIAAVNGVAFGGGLELLLACDIAVAADTARIGDRHIAAAQVPGWGSSVMLPQAIGPAAARRLLLTGETWTGLEAMAHGLVSECVPADALRDRVTALAEHLAALDPAAIARMLRVARPAVDETAWDREWQTLTEHLASQEKR
ncbi:enoyl-CoA hydratase/isomerase family protein [Dactylosporangium sp. CS-033363]|uniref:enoyl-CoA hydratase/isomerase family protein n=1 Tax=Dactylosporangium sp. CS-033363 TaxID=3239935 RepID=UPI003D9157DE